VPVQRQCQTFHIRSVSGLQPQLHQPPKNAARKLLPRSKRPSTTTILASLQAKLQAKLPPRLPGIRNNMSPLTGQCALIFRWNQFSYRTFCQEEQDHFQLEWQLAWSDPILQGFARRGGLPAATEKLSSRESHSAFFVSCLSGLAGQTSIISEPQYLAWVLLLERVRPCLRL